jgi:hypothetical protein
MSESSFDRRAYLVALAVKNDVTPAKNTFVAFARKTYTRFPVSKRTLKEEIDIVVSAWYRDRWISIIEASPYFNREETDEWKRKHSRKP